MKFTDGMWLVRPGMRPQYAAEAYDVAATAEGVTVHAPVRRIEHRGSVLNQALLTVRLTTPLPGVIGVEVTHHAGFVERGPRFELGTDPEHRPETDVGAEAVEIRSGSLRARVRSGAPWHLEFAHGDRMLTTNGTKALGFVETAEGGHHMLGQLCLGVGETVYGLGERFTAFVKNGQVVDVWNADSGTASEQAYKNIPFYLSSRGYGVLVADPGRSVVGRSTRIYRGGTDRGCLEGPHLYKHNGFYYLMAAEGGTGFGHGVTLARSTAITGPYRPAPNNPFLTSNPAPHFGRNDRDYLRPHLFNPRAEVQKAGHGSLVDTPDGEWYVAHLCARPLPPHQRAVLGRETALQKVEWTPDGWLRLTTGDTVARRSTPAPSGADIGAAAPEPEEVRDDFDGPVIDKRLSTLRTRLAADWARLDDRPGSLTLRGREALTSLFDVSIVATQLQDPQATAETRVSFSPTHYSQSAGLVVYYDNRHYAFLRVYRSESLGSTAIGVLLVEGGGKRELLLDRVAVPDGDVVLHARIDTGALRFRWARPGGPPAPIGPTLDATMMSDETTRGFAGTMVGIACQDGYRRSALAHFAYFDLRHGGRALRPHAS